MPVYVFRCQNCGTDFDKLFRTFTSSEEEVSTPCPYCGATETRRRVVAVSILKGASPGVGRAAYPTSWRQTNAGDPETIKYWKRRVEREVHQESQDPGLKVEREITANGQWNDYLTRGLSGRETAEALQAAASVADHAHEGHDHSHSHPHPSSHSQGAQRATPSANSTLGSTPAGATADQLAPTKST